MGKWSTTFQKVSGMVPTNQTTPESCSAGFRKAIAANQLAPTANNTTSQLRLQPQHGQRKPSNPGYNQPTEQEYRSAVAAFLIQRGKSSFLDVENGWPRATVHWSPGTLDVDYGMPGVFLKYWTNAMATYDCNTRTGSIVMY